MSADAIVAGQVAIEARVDQVNQAVGDLGKLTKSIERIDKTAARAGKSFNFISTLVAFNVVQRNIGKINKAMVELVDQIDLLDKGSKRLGLTAQEFRLLSTSVQLAGGTVEQFETAFMAMQRNIANLGLTPSGGEAKNAFESLGLSFEQLAAMDPAERLYSIAGAMQKFGSQSDRAALAMKIFGEGGAKLLPFLDQGEAGLRELKASIGSIIGDIGEDKIQAFVHLKDATSLWSESILAAKANLLSLLTPVLVDLLAATVGLASAYSELAASLDEVAASADAASESSKKLWTEMDLLAGVIDYLVRQTMLAKKAWLGMKIMGYAVAEAWDKTLLVFYELADVLSFGIFDHLETGINKLKQNLEEYDKTFEELNAEANAAVDEIRDYGKKSADALEGAKARADEFKATLEAVRKESLESNKSLSQYADQMTAAAEQAKKVKAAVADFSGRFKGEAINVRNAAGQGKLEDMLTKQLTVLKKIEENTGNIAIVGV